MATRTATCDFYPDTCECVLRGTCTASDGNNSVWATPNIEITEILTTCDAHAEITDPNTLYIQVKGEMAPLTELRSAVRQVSRNRTVAPFDEIFFTYAVIQDWYVKEDRSIHATIYVWNDLSTNPTGFTDYLDAISGLTYDLTT